MSQYKCTDEKHEGELDLIPRCCLKKLVNKKNALLEFVKIIGWMGKYSDQEIKDFNDVGHYYEALEARKLLKEIGEL